MFLNLEIMRYMLILDAVQHIAANITPTLFYFRDEQMNQNECNNILLGDNEKNIPISNRYYFFNIYQKIIFFISR